MRLFIFIVCSLCWFNGHSQQLTVNEIKELGFLPLNSLDSFFAANAYVIDNTNTISPGDSEKYTYYKKKSSTNKIEGIFLEPQGYDPAILVFISSSDAFYNSIKKECEKDKSCKLIKSEPQNNKLMYCKDELRITFTKANLQNGLVFMIKAEPMCQQCLESMIDSK